MGFLSLFFLFDKFLVLGMLDSMSSIRLLFTVLGSRKDSEALVESDVTSFAKPPHHLSNRNNTVRDSVLLVSTPLFFAPTHSGRKVCREDTIHLSIWDIKFSDPIPCSL